MKPRLESLDRLRGAAVIEEHDRLAIASRTLGHGQAISAQPFEQALAHRLGREPCLVASAPALDLGDRQIRRPELGI